MILANGDLTNCCAARVQPEGLWNVQLWYVPCAVEFSGSGVEQSCAELLEGLLVLSVESKKFA